SSVLRDRACPRESGGGGDVVEQQRAILEMAAGQSGFDEGLLAAQPVERGIDLLGGDAAEPQHLAQRMAGGGGIQHPRRRQFGRRLEQAGDDQGQRQIAAAMRRAVPSAASTWPCGSARTISTAAAAGSSLSPRNTARSCSMRSAGQRDRLARVRFLVLPAWR